MGIKYYISSANHKDATRLKHSLCILRMKSYLIVVIAIEMIIVAGSRFLRNYPSSLR